MNSTVMVNVREDHPYLGYLGHELELSDDDGYVPCTTLILIKQIHGLYLKLVRAAHIRQDFADERDAIPDDDALNVWTEETTQYVEDLEGCFFCTCRFWTGDRYAETVRCRLEKCGPIGVRLIGETTESFVCRKRACACTIVRSMFWR
jgi:hypothetical protein